MSKLSWKHVALVGVAALLGTASVGAQTAVGLYARYREVAAASVTTPPSGFQNVFLDSSDHKMKRKNSSASVTTIEGGGGGGVTSVTCGTGLTGGTITTTGTCAVAATQTIDTLNATAATGKTITAAVANSGSNVAFILNNTTTLGGSTKLVSVRNNSTPSLEVDYIGNVQVTAGTAYTSFANTGVIVDYTGFAAVLVGGGVRPLIDNAYTNGAPATRWYNTASNSYDTAIGTQLTAASTITPTSGKHHITGATPITTIDPTNLPGNSRFCGIADGGTITFSTGGNIAVGATILINHTGCLEYDSGSTTWYPQ